MRKKPQPEHPSKWILTVKKRIMKKLLLISMLMLAMVDLFAQAKPKPKETEKPPTQKEMEEMMKELDEEMDEMSPEDKKMMDSMGIKMPDMKALKKTVSGISDAQIKKAYEDDNRIVPQKDPARINTALSTTISTAQMGEYIQKIHTSVLNKLSANTKATGAEVVQQIKRLNKSAANTAVGLWIDGKPTLALYLIGEACKANPADAVALNNYASFLTMCGAEQLALPILNNLNKRYPRNSSILNNITQAWLGLGDIERANKYADSTLRIYASHPQANMAKCVIEESKGNIPAAIAAAKKGISKAYSSEKEQKLDKLGYDLKPDDINWDPPMPQDAMGLGRFKWPDAPLDVEDNKALELEWKTFKMSCEKEINQLKEKQEKAEQVYKTVSEKRMADLLIAGQKGYYAQLLPGYAAKAIQKLGPGVESDKGNMVFVFGEQFNAVLNALSKVDDYQNVLSEKQKILDEKYHDLIGEGRPNPFAAICKDENAIFSEFLNSANGGLQSAYKGYLNYSARRTSDLLYYYQYTMWPEQFELVKIIAQIMWLTSLKDQRVFFQEKSEWCKIPPKVKKPGGPLQNFDDVACQYVSTMDLGVYKITSSCSNLTGEFNFGGVEINLKDNVETGRYSGSALVGVSKGFDGPMGTEVEASIAALVEWDNTGTTDIGGIAGVSANAGGQTIIGADVKVTVNSGISTSGKGILQGIK